MISVGKSRHTAADLRVQGGTGRKEGPLGSSGRLKLGGTMVPRTPLRQVQSNSAEKGENQNPDAAQ